MPKLVWAVTCQRAIVSQQNTVTLVDVLEEIQLPPPPKEIEEKILEAPALIPVRFAVVALWERRDAEVAGNFEARLRMLGPSGKPFGMSPFTINLALFPRFRSISESSGLPYLGPGEYVARIEVREGKRWKSHGKTGFTLKLSQKSPRVRQVTPRE